LSSANIDYGERGKAPPRGFLAPRARQIPARAVLGEICPPIETTRRETMEEKGDKVENKNVKFTTQDKLALKEYTNKAIGSLKNQELDAMKQSILGTIKGWLGIGSK
jgi:hypothetical protein